MIIGAADVAEIRAAADSASRRLGRDVNVTVLTSDEWQGSVIGFVAHLKSEPLVDLDLAGGTTVPAKRPEQPAGRRVK